MSDQLMPLEASVLARESAGRDSYLNPDETAGVDAVSRELRLWRLDAPEEAGGMNQPMVAMVDVNGELGRSVASYYLPPHFPNLRTLMAAADENASAKPILRLTCAVRPFRPSAFPNLARGPIRRA